MGCWRMHSERAADLPRHLPDLVFALVCKEHNHGDTPLRRAVIGRSTAPAKTRGAWSICRAGTVVRIKSGFL